MTPIERATAAIIDELRRQALAGGCVAEDNGISAQVECSFKVEPLARAVIAAIREPSEGMKQALRFGSFVDVDEVFGEETVTIDAAGGWHAMIDALLAEATA